jgi:hypothetical protein
MNISEVVALWEISYSMVESMVSGLGTNSECLRPCYSHISVAHDAPAIGLPCVISPSTTQTQVRSTIHISMLDLYHLLQAVFGSWNWGNI